MPLEVGNIQATQGMTEAIYLAIDAVLQDDVDEEQLDESREAWRKLSFAIADGVVKYIKRDPPSETEYAESFSSSAQDGEFWAWLAGFAQVFADWSSAPGVNVANLKSGLDTFLTANPAPTELKGVVR